MPTIAEAITEGATRLRGSGVDEDRRTAGLLLGHALGLDRSQLIVRSNQSIDETSYHAYLDAIERRARGEPLQYITGHQEFYGLDFIVTTDVLIPRPETEFLVENIIKLARQNERGLLIVDAGTGSGCIAITLAAHIPNARIIAIDVSSRALDVARENAARHRVSARIEFVEGDLLEPLKNRFEGEVDFLASNPPYVPTSLTEPLQREVGEWEPRLALFGGEEGLDFYERLFTEGKALVKRGGYLVCEIGYDQLGRVREMIDPTSWRLIEVTDDLQGIPRTIIARRI